MADQPPPAANHRRRRHAAAVGAASRNSSQVGASRRQARGVRAGYSAPPPRPVGVTIGSIWLIVLGILWILGGAACAVGGGVIGGLGGVHGREWHDDRRALALWWRDCRVRHHRDHHWRAADRWRRGRLWWPRLGRWIGIILSVIFLLFGLLGLLGSIRRDEPQRAAQPASSSPIVWLVGYGFTAYAYIAASQYFSYRR